MKIKKITGMLLAMAVFVLPFLISSCGNEEPKEIEEGKTSRTDPPTTDKDDVTEDPPMDGIEDVPKSDHLFRDEDIYTNIGATGGKKTIVFNFDASPYLSFAVSEDFLGRKADGKIKIEMNDIDNTPSYCIHPTHDPNFYHAGDVVNSLNYRYDIEALETLKELGVTEFFDEGKKPLKVVAGKDGWITVDINYDACTITFDAKPNETGKRRMMTFVMSAYYLSVIPEPFVCNAIRVQQGAN